LACGGGVAGRRHVINHDYIRKLMAAGIIAKAAIDGDGRRVRYTLTERAGKVLGDLYRQTDDLR
jgi:DNA-binding MarR family transcriptional regulator